MTSVFCVLNNQQSDTIIALTMLSMCFFLLFHYFTLSHSQGIPVVFQVPPLDTQETKLLFHMEEKTSFWAAVDQMVKQSSINYKDGSLTPGFNRLKETEPRVP